MTARPHGRRGTSRRDAFTLIELLVTMLIIGIIVGLLIVVIPKVRIAVDKASTQAQMAAIATSCQAYYNDFRAYPGPIPNNQLGGAFYSTQSPANIVALGTTTASGTTYSASGFGTSQPLHVTGAENLVLGLCGGLDYDTADGVIGYNPYDIFPDGLTPNAKGPAGLNPALPKRYNAYITIKTGDISPFANPSGTPGSYVDTGGRSGTDSMIPEFLDKFSNPMPILYMRANVGATGVVTKGGVDENTATVIHQYELAHVLDYTASNLGIITTSSLTYHGLQGIVPSASSPITDTVTQDYASAGANALVYLKDPNTPAYQPNGTTLSTNASASARQKDAFILISAGPDGVYGTADDIVYPGGTVSP
jgi:prepilin-type N-terminal cleavage/methylation domain-containing protein